MEYEEELITVNRNAITVIPQKPYFDWINYLHPESIITPDDMHEYNSYLVNGGFAEPEKVVKKHYKTIFETELFDMWTDENDWPQKRTFKIFAEWFDCKVSAIVYDLGKGGIYKE